MIEYRIEMKVNDEWVRAKRPFRGNLSQHIKTHEEAAYRMFKLQNEWAFTWNKLSDTRKQMIDKPTDFRIMKREIQGWGEA